MPDEQDSGACGRCEETIPTDVKRCPICGYRPAGHSPRLTLLWEAGAVTLLLAAVATFAIGVGGAVLDVPVGAFDQLAIVTPYIAGFSGFFTYYLHRKRRLTPTDDQVFGCVLSTKSGTGRNRRSYSSVCNCPHT